MQKQMMIAALVALAGCGAPHGTGSSSGGGGTTSTIPDVLRQNLDSATYNPTAKTLSVQLSSLDATPFTADYTRNPSLDVAGYAAYEVHEFTQQRDFIALFKQSARNNVMAGTVADGGQFVNYFGGGIYAQVSLFTRPSGGLAVYNGSYVGLLNTGAATGPLDPAAPYRTQGTVRVTADFLQGGSITGGISNRTVVDTGAVLDDVFMDGTSIGADGVFQGTMMFGDRSPIGDYGGIFAGLGATDVAGIMVFTPVRGNSLLFEHGVFVLPCDPTGSSIACP